MQDNDLISRAALLTAYDAAHKGPPGVARKLMEEAPAVDAAPVVYGFWIACDDCGELECSVCGGIQIERGGFCTHCGARMMCPKFEKEVDDHD